MYRHLERRLAEAVRDFLRRTYHLDLPNIVIEQPPRVEMGEYALPLPFDPAARTSLEVASSAGVVAVVSSPDFLGTLGFGMLFYSLNSWLGMYWVGDEETT